jgi:aminoglycoside phosphotransferase (APT) family kinase protein
MSGAGPDCYQRAQAHRIEDAAALVEGALGRRVARIERDDVAGSRAVYFVTLADGLECVLRVATSPGQDLALERWAMEQCRARGVPVPEILAGEMAPTGGSPPYVIDRRMPGALAHDASLSDSERRSLLAQMSAHAAPVHSIALPRFGTLQREGDGYAGSSISLAESVCRNADYYLEKLPEEALSSAWALAIRDRFRNARELLDRAQGVLIHGDFRFQNALLDGGRLSALVDFELAFSGDPAHDLASLFYSDGRDDADLAAILEAYGRPDLLAPLETLHQRLLLYQMLYALDGLWWEHSFHDEQAAENERQRLRRYEEALDRS